MREFTATAAHRTRVPLLIGIAGHSNSGKTVSAHRLARGIARVIPGRVHGIDSESDRMLHVAHDSSCKVDALGMCGNPLHFDFDHVRLTPPFHCSDYLEALRYCAARGASVTIVDSASHMHEGQGGMLDQHEHEIDRILRNKPDASWEDRDKASFRAWRQPKADLQRFVQCLLQMNVVVIMCFRAKDKLKPGKVDGKTALVDLGTCAIADDSLIYEMTCQPLLEAGARGVPTWNPTLKGERLQVKLPGQFAEFLKQPGKPLDEDMGEAMGRWAMGDAAGPARTDPDRPVAAKSKRDPGPTRNDGGPISVILNRIAEAATVAEVSAIGREIADSADQWSEEEKNKARAATRARNMQLQGS